MSGKSVNNILAVWAVADTTIVADAISTALFFVKPKDLERDFDFEYLIVKSDHTYSISPNLDCEIYTT